jgi:hypothetical protein
MGEGWRDSAGVRSEHPQGEGLGVRSELPIKATDHAMDATRYALHTALRKDRGARMWMRAWLPDRREPDGA